MADHRATPVTHGKAERVPAVNPPPDAAEGFRLSPQQRHLWRLHRADGGQAYLAQCVVRIDGPLRLEILRAALNDVIRAHEILRTRYVVVDTVDLPEQVIDEDSSPWLDEHRLPGRDAEAFAGKVDDVLKGLVFEPGSLGDRPLVRFALVADASGRCALLISAPALSMDATGLSCLVGQISRSYDARSRNDEYGEAPLQYADLAEW